MHDTYGDGWNGGFLTITLNNTVLGNCSASNFASTSTFQVCNGDTLRLNYTAGSYENENSYQLFDAAFNLLFANGPTPQTGNVFTTIANCFSIAVPGSNACTAIPIDTGQCLMGNNTGFLGTGINPNCASYTGGDVWYLLQVPPSGNLSFVTDSGTINDTGIAIWGDSACSNLHLLGCDDDGGTGYFSSLFLGDLTPNQTLYIQVFGYSGATGTFQLCVKDLGIIRCDSSELPIVLIKTFGQPII